MADNLQDKEEDRLLARFESLIKEKRHIEKELIEIKERIRKLNKKNEDEH